MTINLSKGQKIDLRKTDVQLQHLEVGLGWNPNPGNGAAFDPDASAFLLGTMGQCQSDKDFIFYNNPASLDGAIQHTGDDRTGGSSESGPDEIIKIDLSRLSAQYVRIDFAVTIFEAAERHQNFGQMSGIFMNIVNKDTGEELVRYDLDEDFSFETSVIFGALLKEAGEWYFKAVGEGSTKDLEALVRHYGLEV